MLRFSRFQVALTSSVGGLRPCLRTSRSSQGARAPAGLRGIHRVPHRNQCRRQAVRGRTREASLECSYLSLSPSFPFLARLGFLLPCNLARFLFGSIAFSVAPLLFSLASHVALSIRLILRHPVYPSPYFWVLFVRSAFPGI